MKHKLLNALTFVPEIKSAAAKKNYGTVTVW